MGGRQEEPNTLWEEIRMKRLVALASVGVMLLTICLWPLDAWARAGGGKSAGSRGSRSSSAPAQHDPGLASSNRQAVPPSAVQQSMPQRSGWMSGLMGGITGFVLGGLIGSMLFGGFGSGLFGGLGMLEMLLIGGLIYLAFVYMRRRQQPAPASPYGYGPPQGIEMPSWRSESRSASTTTMGTTESDLDRGLRHISLMDSTFDPERFAATASEVFFTIQTAWAARDMGAARDLMTPDMYETMQKECDRLRAERRMNRLEHLTVRRVQVTEAWQETGQDFVTVHILANLLDYTVDETSHQVVAGSSTEPVQFAEYWTFVRPIGPNPWKLSAIQQAE